MAYTIRYVPAKDLERIQDEWKALETGEEMTLFQSYEWYQMLLEKYIPEDTKNFESVYAVVKADGKACMIAPLWIIKRSFRILNKKGGYIIGRFSFSDYLNFIYLTFDADAFDFLMKDLRRRYCIKKICFEDFRESTSIYQHVIKSYSIIENKKFPCVTLQLPHTIEEYNKMLSKNSRQNLRTANNRLQKDGKALIFNDDDQQVDRQECLRLREAKLSVQFSSVSKWRKYKYRIINHLRYSFPFFTPVTYYPHSKIMTAYDGQGKLRAFFNYAYDYNKKTIRIMAAGTDLDFARYSPGMLLMHQFIEEAIKQGQLEIVDFTRGGEPYKFALGGNLCYNHRVIYKITYKKSL